MKTILYATDYSENSELALKYAHNMSVKMKAKLLVIHVFDNPTFLVFSFGVHGLIADSVRPPATKGELITFPLLMWVFQTIMFLVFVFLISPIHYPDVLMDM
ncbi:universal stress protein [Thalassobellus suaedae]|uniref:Universal stress protein n=1 Tax=Thalassobellus suaedae TaxID=3074124 RepID=A0ABY9Y5E5_9FLAO|nr:universal stress protein [Flavobacteriaceae bacterium HL-DH10]